MLISHYVDKDIDFYWKSVPYSQQSRPRYVESIYAVSTMPGIASAAARGGKAYFRLTSTGTSPDGTLYGGSMNTMDHLTGFACVDAGIADGRGHLNHATQGFG